MEQYNIKRFSNSRLKLVSYPKSYLRKRNMQCIEGFIDFAGRIFLLTTMLKLFSAPCQNGGDKYGARSGQ